EFAEDLDRLRAGRYDHLRPPARRLMEAGTPKEILCRLSVVRVDVDRPSDAEVQHALRELETVLEDPKLAAAAWAVLVEDASEMCARRGRRTRDELVALLAAQSIKVTPPPA